jgi:hypothetical protein
MIPKHTGGLGDAAFIAALHQGGAVSVFTLFLYDRFKKPYFSIFFHAALPAYVRRKKNPSLYRTLSPPFDNPNSQNSLNCSHFEILN